EKLLFQDGPLCDCRRPAGTREHRQQSDDDYTQQGVPEVDLGARVLQFLEMSNDFIQPDLSSVCHGSPPVALLFWKPHRGRYTRKQPRAQALQITKITYKCALALTPTPVFGNEAEQPMLDLVPLAGARRKVTNLQGHSQFVRQTLQRLLP